MIGVFERNRTVSEFEFHRNAVKVRVEVNKPMASSSVVPKAYRPLSAVPTVETARSIACSINRAGRFYPNTGFNVLERRRRITLAIADCDQLLQDLQCPPDIGPPINVNRLEALVEMADREIAPLKGHRKAVKLTGRQTVEERIADREAEIDGLRAI